MGIAQDKIEGIGKLKLHQTTIAYIDTLIRACLKMYQIKMLKGMIKLESIHFL